MKGNISACFLVLVLTFVFSCSGGSNKAYIDTYGMKIISGKLSSYDYSEGFRGDLIDIVDVESGPVEIKLPSSKRLVLIELTNAAYIDHATGATVEFGSMDKWVTIVTKDTISTPSNPLQLNPFTTLGVGIAEFKSSYSVDFEETALISKDTVGEHFKFDLDNSPFSVDEDLEAATDESTIKYYLAIAGLSMLAESIQKMNVDIFPGINITLCDLTRILKSDVTFDGLADGIGENGHLSLGVYNFSKDTLRLDLVDAIEKFMQENDIEMTDQIRAFLYHLKTSTSALFFPDGYSVFDHPSLDLLNPIEGSFVNGTVRVTVQSSDYMKTQSLDGFLYLDSFDFLPLTDLNILPDIFEADIDTSNYDDGAIKILARMVDTSGHVSEKLFSVLSDNTGPEISSNLDTVSFARGILPVEISMADIGGSGVKSLEVKIDGVPVFEEVNANDSYYEYSYDTEVNLEDGFRIVEIEVSDNLDNKAVKTYELFVNNNLLSNDIFFQESGGVFSIGSYSTSIVGDIDGDGFTDAITSRNTLLKNIKIYFGEENNGFSAGVDSNTLSISTGEVSIAANCDFNNDGKIDLAIGNSESLLGFGRVRIYYGPYNRFGDNWFDFSILNSVDGFLGEGFGKHIDCFDINNDNYADLIIGTASSDGRTYAYLGPQFSTKAIIQSNNSGFVKKLGDINGDNFTDLVIGNKIVYGSQVLNNLMVGDMPTYDSISPVGDLNEDGYDDVVIGRSPNAVSQSFAMIMWGGPNFLNSYYAMFPSSNNGGEFGASVVAGDYDGDGFIDIAVGSPNDVVYVDNSPRTYAGQIYIFFGPNYLSRKKITADVPQAFGHFGFGLVGGFDLNQDGLDDLLVQEPGDYFSDNNTGSFHIMYDVNQ